MIKEILNLLLLDDHFGQSDNIDIAKGRYSIPKNWSNGLKQIKREWQRIKQ